MATQSVLQAVQHYQRSIEKNPSDVSRLLHCVGKLYKLPITVSHLEETGIGRTVNALRKHNGELGVAAEAVVNKWKEIVASESDRRANDQSSSEDENNEHNKLDEIDDDAERRHSHKSTSSMEHMTNDKQNKDVATTKSQERHQRHKSEHKDKDRHNSKDKSKKHHKSKHEDSSSTTTATTNDKEKKDKRESSGHKRRKDEEKNTHEAVSLEEKERKLHKHKSSREDEKKTYDTSRHHHKSSSEKHKSHDKHNTESKEREKTYSKSHSHTHKKTPISDDATLPTPSTAGATEPTTSKRRHEDAVLNDSSPKKHKSHHSAQESKPNRSTKKQQHVENNEQSAERNDDDGIDSSMGANFADVLGMLNMPQKKAKKSLNVLKQTSPTSSKKNVTETSSQKTNTASKLKSERDFDRPSTSSQINLEKKPSLLNSNVKLAPLDPSIALELPVISNNYKPLPLNPTVMDCVFNSSTSSSSRAPPRLFSDAEALSHGISSKTIRTKVYSGVKSGQLFQVPSLFDLCIRVLQKNIDAMEYTGGVPFDVLRPVLERGTPQQLFTFEEFNPYIMEDSDVLWQQHVQRTYRGQKRQEMESWREMFMRCQEEQERRLSMLAQNIKHSQKVMAEPVRKTQLAFVDTLVKPPRNVMRKQELHGTKSKLVATPAARVAALSSVTPNAAKPSDVRLRTAAALSYDPAQAASRPARPKKAPLMAKTLQFIRGRQRR